MPKIERKKHEVNSDSSKEEDIIIKSKGFQFYFQNFYTLISLANDLLTGILYLIASILSLLGFPHFYTTSLYLLGAIFLTFRPLIKIIHNTFLSREQQGQTRSEKEAKSDLEDAEENLEQAEKDREQAERDRKKAEKENAQKEESSKTETIDTENSQGETEEQRDKNKEERDKAARERELEEKNRKLNKEHTTSEESEQDKNYIKRLFTPSSKLNQDKNQQDEDNNTNQ